MRGRKPAAGGVEAAARDKPWLFRTYAGHSTAAKSNELYRANLAKGQTGLSIAFDLPTQTAYDSDHAGIACEADEILITSGSLQGLDLVNGLLLSAGDTVLVEEDCYSGSLTRLSRRGVNVIGVPLDSDGLRLDLLGNALADLKRKGIRPKYLYTIPTVQNPTGTIMTEKGADAW